jgi:cation-transporting P-type ATPase E
VILGIVPSGLFLMITVAYSMGALRLTRRQALVQQVNAVESLSNVDVFCADKTGTLTTNRLQLAEIAPVGVDDETLRRHLGRFAAATTSINATVEAIARAFPADHLPVASEAPFSSARKWSAVAFDCDAECGAFILGAPEMIQRGQSSSAKPPANWYQKGWRVLLLASCPEPVMFDEEDPVLPGDLRIEGWIALADELRPNLHQTLEGFRTARVRLKIISGDNPMTVAALARQAGFPRDARLISGIDIEGMSDGEFSEAVEEGDIFGRITPQQKERIVQELRGHGHYVAMTGDGVNDVLSVKHANLGIAMQSGSQATRAVADMILLDDSFAAVPAAFSEGQRIRRGLQDVLDLFLVRVFTVSLIIMAVVFVDGGFPFAPANMTLLTLLTVGIPTFALALFAHPGAVSGRIFYPLLKFVLPATTLLAIVSLTVYLGFYFMNDVDLTSLRERPVSNPMPPTASDAVARDALTYVMVLAGLFLVVFVAPPNEWWAVVEPTDHDWRPTIVAISMVPLYIAILAIPWTRRLFDIALLSLVEYILIGLAVVVWALLLRFTWKARIFERFFAYQ